MKIKYEVLAIEVEKLYLKKFNVDQIDEIEAHCNYIIEFIRSAGWTEEEYIRAMFGFDNKNES